MVYLVTSAIAQIILCRKLGWFVNNELERIGEELAAAQFEAQSLGWTGSAEERHENVNQDS
jgi:hypothetical protein